MTSVQDTEPFWLTFFADLAADEWEAGTAFWLAVTGYALSAPRGEHGEFATLVPPEGDDHFRVQRVGGDSGVHLDLHVRDLHAAVGTAVSLGATLVDFPGHAVLRSPAGFGFCFVGEGASRPAAPAAWPSGHRSLVDQLAIDIPAVAYDAEVRFWSGLTGWPARPAGEFARLMTPAALPVRVLFQEISEGPIGGHLDIATDDREAEVARLTALGAVPGAGGARWTVLRPPAGPPCCVTDRSPDTGLLPSRPG
jgi:hypothetical protein